ncbi:hypothetical protein AB1Y20_010694 [Prymnesium parvum]|uniref:Uncharacterized protein n=1 Tax=Prymnesium parvum TaxID=97485 RepID=A0AB34IQH4_PRYPA
MATSKPRTLVDLGKMLEKSSLDRNGGAAGHVGVVNLSSARKLSADSQSSAHHLNSQRRGSQDASVDLNSPRRRSSLPGSAGGGTPRRRGSLDASVDLNSTSRRSSLVGSLDLKARRGSNTCTADGTSIKGSMSQSGSVDLAHMRRSGVSASYVESLLNEQDDGRSGGHHRSILSNRQKSIATSAFSLEITEEDIGQFAVSPIKVPLSPDQLLVQKSLLHKYDWAVNEAEEYNALAAGERHDEDALPRLHPGEASSPFIKNMSYYKRNWTQGRPGKQTAAWEETERIPAIRRSLFVRPDLEINSLNRAMEHLVQEQERVAIQRQWTMWHRQKQRQALRIRHEERDRQQRCLGAKPVNRAYGSLLRASASTGILPVPVIFAPQSTMPSSATPQTARPSCGTINSCSPSSAEYPVDWSRPER